MAAYIVRSVLAVMMVTSMGAALEQGHCCPPGELLIKRRIDSKFSCWDHQANTTNFITLPCNETGNLRKSPELDYYINTKSSLVIQLANMEVEYEPNSFCTGNYTTLRDVNLSRVIETVVLCYEEEIKILNESVFGYCMAVSSIFLIITALIYIVLPELRDLQGKSIINFCLSLGIGLGILAGMKLVTYTDMGLCAARGFLTYFFTISSFFWTNAISIQILFSIRRPTVINYGWKEFIYYAIYAWGCPAILTIVMAIINFIPGKHLKPGIGLNHCWFFNKGQQWRYMYSVMSIHIAVNICIFIYISIQLWRQTFSSSHIKALRYKFLMTIRLFIVMGVSWIFEMIGSGMKNHIIWEIFDLINSLQGVLVFLVLVIFRKRTIKMLHRHGYLDCISGPVERFLAVGEDEEDVVQHTVGISLDDNKDIKN